MKAYRDWCNGSAWQPSAWEQDWAEWRWQSGDCEGEYPEWTEERGYSDWESGSQTKTGGASVWTPGNSRDLHPPSWMEIQGALSVLRSASHCRLAKLKALLEKCSENDGEMERVLVEMKDQREVLGILILKLEAAISSDTISEMAAAIASVRPPDPRPRSAGVVNCEGHQL